MILVMLLLVLTIVRSTGGDLYVILLFEGGGGGFFDPLSNKRMTQKSLPVLEISIAAQCECIPPYIRIARQWRFLVILKSKF